MTNNSMRELLLSVTEQHGLSGTSVLSTNELAELPQCHGVPEDGVRGDFLIEGKAVSLSLALSFSSPYYLPLVFMHPWDAFGVIPHVETDGYVCYAQPDGLIIDPNRFEEVVSTSLNNAISQIRAGARKENTSDFIDEFLSYWNRQKEILDIGSFVEPSNEPKLVRVFVEGNTYKYVCDRKNDLKDFLSGADAKHFTLRNALYIPLPDGTVIIPPHPNTGWSPAEATAVLFGYLNNIATKNIAKLCCKLTKREELVIVHLPLMAANGGALFGFRYEGVDTIHPLAGGPPPKSIRPVRLSRYDKSFIMPRGGANVNMYDKRVLIVGCGSVGGFLAVELARAGIRHLTLVDHDHLDVANIFRHVLGRQYLSEKGSKAELLAKHIADNIPYMDVLPVPYRIEQAIKNGAVNPSGFDLIIVALGVQATELYLNRLAKDANGYFPPLIFSWVEAYGIGWHVQVSNNIVGKEGCLECLYTNLPDDKSGLHCRASFAEAGQKFGQNMSGCSGLFLPYGSAIAVHAALLAVETAIDVLKGDELGNPQLSIKGSSRAFTEAGFTLTDRYRKSSNEDLFQQRYAYANPACSVCGGRQ